MTSKLVKETNEVTSSVSVPLNKVKVKLYVELNVDEVALSARSVVLLSPYIVFVFEDRVCVTLNPEESELGVPLLCLELVSGED